ncbi:DUF4349 domain-containing protein [Spirochaetia bacterium 38H-sp]|uniref:DUF4349 domain-containing protein n=1 Tax=Rarispira pelagica TaxID=3141764 RepID=A0ABU9UBP2_9SPIR
MKKILLSVFFVLLLASCSQKTGEYGLSGLAAPKAESPAKEFSLASDTLSRTNAAPPAEVAMERKLIRQGYIRLEVKELANTADEIKNNITEIGGYISSTDMREDEVYMELRVPADKFDMLFKEIGGLGRVLSSNQNVEDITDSYYDLETRLKNAYVLEEKYRQYLGQAKNIEDILKVEQYLSDVRSRIENMEAQKRRYDKDVSYSILRVNLVLPPEKTSTAYPSFYDYLSALWLDVVSFFVGFVFILLRIIIFGIPILGAVLFFYWLLWGKLGLLRKLLVVLGRDKK